MRTFQLERFIVVFFLSQCITRRVVARNVGELIFDEEFNTLHSSRWHHVITGWRGGNGEFQYYTNRTENSNDFLYTGTLDLNKEGCNIDWNGGCVMQSGEEIINPIQSARIVTSKSFSFTYGTVSSTPMRTFWEKKCEWYPTWYRTSRDDSAIQVDYIRVWNP